MRLPRPLLALAVGAAVALLGPSAAAAASSPRPDLSRPDLYSFSAGRGTFQVEHGTVTLRLSRVRKAIPLSSRALGRLGRGVGVPALVAAAEPGSTLTAEIGGPTDEDSLSLRVRSVRGHGRRLVVRGTRLGRHARIRARHSWNAPDLRLPARMRAVGLMLDTDPTGPLLRVDGRRAPDVVIAFDHTRPSSATASAAPTIATFHPWPGLAESLLIGEVRRADLTCDVAASSPEPLEAEFGDSFFIPGDGAQGYGGQPLQLPRQGERIPIATPAPHFEVERGVTVVGDYGTTFDVSFEFASEVAGILSLKVQPPRPGAEVGAEVVCRGTVEGGDETEFGIPQG